MIAFHPRPSATSAARWRESSRTVEQQTGEPGEEEPALANYFALFAFFRGQFSCGVGGGKSERLFTADGAEVRGWKQIPILFDARVSGCSGKNTASMLTGYTDESALPGQLGTSTSLSTGSGTNGTGYRPGIATHLLHKLFIIKYL